MRFNAMRVLTALIAVTVVIACTPEEVAPADAVTAVAIDAGERSVAVNATLQLSATVTRTGDATTAVLWSSVSEATALVDEDGMVTGVAPGETSITATSAFDPLVSDSAIITVAPEPLEALLGFTGRVPGYSWNVELSIAMQAFDTDGDSIDLVRATIAPAAEASAIGVADAVAEGLITGTLTPLEEIESRFLGSIVDNAGGPPMCEPPDVSPPSLRMSGIRYQWEVTNDNGDVVGTVLYGVIPGLLTGAGFQEGDQVYGFLLAEEAGSATGTCQIDDGEESPDPTHENRNGWIEYDLHVEAGWNRLVGTVLETMNEGGDIALLRLEIGEHETDEWLWFLGGAIVQLSLTPDDAQYEILRDGWLAALGSGSRDISMLPGEYAVRAWRSGYLDSEPVAFSLGSGETRVVSIVLEPDPAD